VVPGTVCHGVDGVPAVPGRRSDRLGVVRISHFWALMDDEFGPSYAGTLARDHVLGALGQRTAVAALADGVPPREVWLALCDDLDVPPERRLGRDDRAAPGAEGGASRR
jgi:hypothetical protein